MLVIHPGDLPIFDIAKPRFKCSPVSDDPDMIRVLTHADLVGYTPLLHCSAVLDRPLIAGSLRDERIAPRGRSRAKQYSYGYEKKNKTHGYRLLWLVC